MKIVRTYSLEWLDSLISVTLNPDKPYLNKIPDSDIAALREKVPHESSQVQYELTNRIFSLSKDSQVRHIIDKYRNSLVALRQTVRSYQQNPAFNTKQLSGLDGAIISSLDELLLFIEKRYSNYCRIENDTSADSDASNASIYVKKGNIEAAHKVLCTLSADQIALILRAADESQILKARSMNAVFKFIIPYLSTPHKENLSAAAVRSKAYNPEEADRDAAIEALHKIIRKIKGY